MRLPSLTPGSTTITNHSPSLSLLDWQPRLAVKGQALDPHGEHDFGSFQIEGETYFWKIDYYDLAMQFGSADAADREQTTRVLTIMRAEDY